MRYLTFNEVLELYHRVMEQSGGAVGIRDLNALESALGPTAYDIRWTGALSHNC